MKWTSIQDSEQLARDLATFWNIYGSYFPLCWWTEILGGYKVLTAQMEEEKKSQRSIHAQIEAVTDMKFTYVATCQNYGNQKRSGDRRATDILNLMVK